MPHQADRMRVGKATDSSVLPRARQRVHIGSILVHAFVTLAISERLWPWVGLNMSGDFICSDKDRPGKLRSSQRCAGLWRDWYIESAKWGSNIPMGRASYNVTNYPVNDKILLCALRVCTLYISYCIGGCLIFRCSSVVRPYFVSVCLEWLGHLSLVLNWTRPIDS